MLSPVSLVEPTSRGDPVRVSLIDDRPLARSGLRALLGSDSRVEVIAEANDSRDALQAVHVFHPEVVVLDVTLPWNDGLETVRSLRRGAPDCASVVMVSNSTNDRHLSEALRVGVRGYLLQQATVGDVVLAILGATTGHTILAPSLAQRLLVSKPAVMREHISEHATLSGRELDVVRHLAEGLTRLFVAKHGSGGAEVPVSGRAVGRRQRAVAGAGSCQSCGTHGPGGGSSR